MRSESFWIGELARRSGVSADTIRYYERIGVLPDPPRSSSGYRIYDDSVLERLKFVGQAQALGLALDEIAQVLEIADEGVEPCEHVRSRLQQRLVEVEARLGELRRLRTRLRTALERAESAPAPDTCRCRIIEGVSARSSAARTG